MKYFRNINIVLERGTVHKNVFLALLEKWKIAVGKGKAFGTLLNYLSKIFNCLSHELFIAKLNVYGLL